MSDSLPVVERMPVERPAGCPFDPPARLAELRSRAPVTPLRFGDGHQGWLVTGHAQARAVLADPGFSSRHELMHLLDPQIIEVPPAGPGQFIGMDAPEHTRYRRLLAGKFTVRRMRSLAERVQRLTAQYLDDMAARGPGVDLVDAYAFPIPAQMICELLGVPFSERAHFQHLGAVANQADVPMEDKLAAFQEMGGYIADLVERKRARPTDDLLSDIIGGDLDHEELVGVGSLLLGAGLDTVANMIGLSTFALLTHPDQRDALHADPERAVEELLRYLTIAHTGFRVALTDIDLDGITIGKGQTVAVSLQAANRDPARFASPDALDLTRQAAGHLAFSHGAHQCLGQQLARLEMKVALPALFERFPSLRLDVPPQEVPLRAGDDVYGVRRLPVAW
ncbi:cytochrome P450 [Actinomadura sp. NEAU-AAG7]|uniref:cytochrome P450 n=1 Tax=Actinomadura sp. NEAU-AAG7 TaxID=2839640 RepID=UPI001BE485E2|nr:cytochrome P450 [Actinomadura sp. NEAU-AAG7]MBT2212553.1 cytochrome P450 [Actinomadura sp. NEAU-AAG7]